MVVVLAGSKEIVPNMDMNRQYHYQREEKGYGKEFNSEFEERQELGWWLAKLLDVSLRKLTT